MKYKVLALLLAVILAFGGLAGCAGTGVQNYDGGASAAPESSGTPDGGAEDTRDYAAARAKYPLDTVVMTINGSQVTWGEYFYWLYYSMSYIEQYVGTIPDLSAASMFDETQTYAQYFSVSARDMVKQYHALEVNAKAAGASLTAEDEAYLQELLASDITACVGEEGTEEDFYAYLEGVYVSPELYSYINQVSCLYNDCFDKLYGGSGELLSDEDAAAFSEANGYMTAKHILLSTVDTEGEALSEEEKAAKLETAKNIAAQLDAAEGDARLALFDELMTDYSEDVGLPSYPEGYCFAKGKMDEAFETAVAGLEDYEISGIVETQFGYHIILRLPTEPDNLVEYYSETEQYTLRYLAAVDAYDVLVGNWITDAEAVWEPEFENLDLNTLFA